MLMDRALPRPLARYAPMWSVINWGLFAAGLTYIVLMVIGVLPDTYGFGNDTHAYWLAGNLDDPYRNATVGAGSAFLYSPAFAQAWWPASFVPFELVAVAWSGLIVAALIWLRAPWMLVLWPMMWDVILGNIFLLTAAVIVAGFRYPAVWAAPILAKVTPGIGLLWFAVRGEWRSLGIALGTTTVIVLVSAMLAPDLWVEWLAVLDANGSRSAQGIAIPLVVRIPIAAALVAWGARTDRAWMLPIGVMLAMPVFWSSSLALLAAVPRLSRRTPSTS